MTTPSLPLDWPQLELIYAVLIGEKRYENGAWHVYDENGVEIENPGWILVQGNIGALLNQSRNPAIAAWLTEQGVARNLAENLRRRAIQDCRVRVQCDPVPAGSEYTAVVRTSARVSAAAFGAEAGTEALCHGRTDAQASPSGAGVSCGCSDGVSVSASASAAPFGSGLRVGGGRVRHRASSRAAPAGTSCIAGSPGMALSQGIKNPTDEELLALAILLIKKRRLTSFPRPL